MNKREIRRHLSSIKKAMLSNPNPDATVPCDDGSTYQSEYLGSFLTLDPCGRYHHCLSPNGITARCERFWQNLDDVAADIGGWVESGEGDPLDIFFCIPIKSTEVSE